jgi:hypothetical protein
LEQAASILVLHEDLWVLRLDGLDGQKEGSSASAPLRWPRITSSRSAVTVCAHLRAITVPSRKRIVMVRAPQNQMVMMKGTSTKDGKEARTCSRTRNPNSPIRIPRTPTPYTPNPERCPEVNRTKWELG